MDADARTTAAVAPDGAARVRRTSASWVAGGLVCAALPIAGLAAGRPASDARTRAARAARDSTRANLERLQGLVQGNYVTPQEFINARASAEQAEAAYRRAAITLSYTDIRAAVAGRSGGLTVRAGNLVAPTDAAPLVTINQTRPIEVQFSLAQQFLPRLRSAQAGGALGVVVLREDGAGELDHGSVVFMDNAVNASTGT